MGIRNKLFLTFLGTFVVLIVAASGFYFFAFEQSLRKYIDERQQAQVERLGKLIAAHVIPRPSHSILSLITPVQP